MQAHNRPGRDLCGNGVPGKGEQHDDEEEDEDIEDSMEQQHTAWPKAFFSWIMMEHSRELSKPAAMPAIACNSSEKRSEINFEVRNFQKIY